MQHTGKSKIKKDDTYFQHNHTSCCHIFEIALWVRDDRNAHKGNKTTQYLRCWANLWQGQLKGKKMYTAYHIKLKIHETEILKCGLMLHLWIDGMNYYYAGKNGIY